MYNALQRKQAMGGGENGVGGGGGGSVTSEQQICFKKSRPIFTVLIYASLPPKTQAYNLHDS